MRTSFARFVKEESGATAIEYGLIAAGIAVAIITAVNTVGTDLSGLFGRHLRQAHRSRQVGLTQSQAGSAPRKLSWPRF